MFLRHWLSGVIRRTRSQNRRRRQSERFRSAGSASRTHMSDLSRRSEPLEARCLLTSITDITPGTAFVDGTVNGGEYVGSNTGLGDGFGDQIGATSTLSVDSNHEGTVSFALEPTGSMGVNDVVVLYIDNDSGDGVTDTTTINDTSGQSERAISGNGSGGETADLTFASDFMATHAITIEDDFAGLYEIANDGTLTLRGSSTFGGTVSFAASGLGDTPELSFELGDGLGLSSGDSFKYFATLINESNAFRSNEFQGVASVPGDNIAAASFSLATGDFHTFATYQPRLDLLDGTTGFRLDGIDMDDEAGLSVSGAGDVNGDGFDDVIVGAPFGDAGAATNIGESYVVFGRSGGFASAIDLSSLNGANGFRLDGIDTSDASGYTVSSAGDVNGDGFGDLIVGADSASFARGEAYVVFGQSGGFTSALSLSVLNGTIGFRIEGLAAGDHFGEALSHADVNGDGYSDLLIGAGTEGAGDEGAAYVVFGQSGGFLSSIDLNTLNGTTGFRLDGIDADDRAGRAVSGAGDFNGDGIEDLILGAFRAGAGGESYLVFGRTGGFASAIDLSSLTGSTGFQINAASANDDLGFSVSGAGDFNGDGFDDLILGALLGDPNGNTNSGESYLLFGRSSGFGTYNLSSLSGTIRGAAEYDQSGFPVASAGDINGDGYDDLLVGSRLADPVSNNEGETYVIFGRPGSVQQLVQLSVLGGTTGVRIPGQDELDLLGQSVSGAGDVNGDGFDDIIVGAPNGDPGSVAMAGESYVVFGGNFGGLLTGGAETQVGDAGDNTLIATQGAGRDFLIGGLGDDVLITGEMLVSDDGLDVLRGGAGDDLLQIDDLLSIDALRLDGGSGTDTLEFTRDRVILDLADVSDNTITDIEIIDIVSAGDTSLTTNTLTVDLQEVLNISSTTNTLTIRRSPRDTVNFGAGWTLASSEIDGTTTIDTFTQDAATLRIETLGLVRVSSRDGSDVFRLNGIDAVDRAGDSVAGIGDLNGDGLDDLIVGAYRADPGGLSDAGETYVVFGRTGGFASTINLGSLNGTTGFRLDGVAAFDASGRVGQGGDINGDGLDDLIIGAPGAPAAYVVFGSTDPFASAIDLAALDGTDGFRFNGGALAGRAVASGVDVNGDGLADLVVAAEDAEEVYVVFGQSGGFASAIGLAALDGTSGFTIDGTNFDDFAERGISGGGDINADGFGDLIIGSAGANPGGDSQAGESYVVFGAATFTSTLDLATLNGTTGFRLEGIDANDQSGSAVAGGGDVNGDGFDDLIIGARSADPGFTSAAGESYVVFGRSGGFASAIDLSTLDGTNGFQLSGGTSFDASGASLSISGDINADGFDDVVIAAPGADPEGLTSDGITFVLFGRSGGFAANFDLDLLAPTDGFQIDGEDGANGLGDAAASAGDVNGDGFDDLILGALAAGPGNVGASVVVFGGDFTG